MTIAPAVLTALSQQEDSEASLTPRSLYGKEGAEKETEHAVTYIHDETMWREAFEKSRDGKGAIKTAQVSTHVYERLTHILTPGRLSRYFQIINCKGSD